LSLALVDVDIDILVVSVDATFDVNILVVSVAATFDVDILVVSVVAPIDVDILVISVVATIDVDILVVSVAATVNVNVDSGVFVTLSWFSFLVTFSSELYLWVSIGVVVITLFVDSDVLFATGGSGLGDVGLFAGDTSIFPSDA